MWDLKCASLKGENGAVLGHGEKERERVKVCGTKTVFHSQLTGRGIYNLTAMRQNAKSVKPKSQTNFRGLASNFTSSNFTTNFIQLKFINNI